MAMRIKEHTDMDKLQLSQTSKTVSGIAGKYTHSHTHCTCLPCSPLVDRLVCDELYVSTTLLKVDFLKTAAHWRGEEMKRERSVCVCGMRCHHHSAAFLSLSFSKCC